MTEHQLRRVPAGWYPDPLGLPQLRWWDNHAWTEHISDSAEPLRVHETVRIDAQPTWAEPEAESSSDGDGHQPRHATPDEADASSLAVVLKESDLEPADDLVESSTSPVALDDVDSSHPDAAPEQAVDAKGWDDVLTAVLKAPLGAIVYVKSAELKMVIDIHNTTYWCLQELSQVPRNIEHATIRVRQAADARLPGTAGRDAEPLLWMLCFQTGAGDSVPRVENTHRYKLRRWPNLVSMDQNAEQLQMTSMLAHAFLTPAELGALSNTDPAEAAKLIAAYKMMGIVVEQPTTAEAQSHAGHIGRTNRSLANRVWRALRG